MLYSYNVYTQLHGIRLLNSTSMLNFKLFRDDGLTHDVSLLGIIFLVAVLW